MSTFSQQVQRWARSPWADVALSIAVAVAQLWPLLTLSPGDAATWHWWGYLVAAGSAAALLIRRRASLVALVITFALAMSYDLGGPVAAQPIWYGPLVALFTVSDQCGRRDRLVALAVMVGGLATVGSSDTAMRGVVLTVAAYALGRAAAGNRAHSRMLDERATRLEQERENESERAAARERARIERDLHDVLAHSISLMVVQAESGPLVVRKDPDRAAAHFGDIAETGREAMSQLRQVLDTGRHDDSSQRPRLADLGPLVTRVQGAGLSVDLAERGTPATLTRDQEESAYRVVQEALTNVVKHAHAHHAQVRVHWLSGEVRIEVENDGTHIRTPPAKGRGLPGIRERAAAVGGTVTAGALPGNDGFLVRLSIPLTGDAS